MYCFSYFDKKKVQFCHHNIYLVLQPSLVYYIAKTPITCLLSNPQRCNFLNIFQEDIVDLWPLQIVLEIHWQPEPLFYKQKVYVVRLMLFLWTLFSIANIGWFVMVRICSNEMFVHLTELCCLCGSWSTKEFGSGAHEGFVNMQMGSQEMSSCEIGCMYLLDKSRIQNEMPYLNWLYNFLCKDILSD